MYGNTTPPCNIHFDLREQWNLIRQLPQAHFQPARKYRQLVVVNKKSKAIVAIRGDWTGDPGCARVTKKIYRLMTDGNHIAYFAHNPTDIRVPMMIGGRYYAKPSKYAESHATIAAQRVEHGVFA